MGNPYTAPKAELVLEPPEPADTWRPGEYSSRLLATFIDLVVVGVVWLPVLWVVDRVFMSDSVAMLALVGVALVYGTIMESGPWQGTLGFKLSRLRVLQEDGRTLSKGQAFVRTLLRVLLGSLVLPFLAIAVTTRNRALWDFPARAHVVGPKRTAVRENAIAKQSLNEEID